MSEPYINNPFEKKSRLEQVFGGGGGGVPDDYEDLKNQVASNTATIAEIKETIQSMSGDDYFFIPIKANEALMLRGAKYIDSGFKLNGDMELSVTGCLPDTTKQAVFVGAYKSNSERTVLKILGQSHKIQSQWAGNVETTAEQVVDMDFTRRISYTQTSNKTELTCSGKTITLANTDYSGSDDETALLLFNQTKSGDFNNGALRFVHVDTRQNSLSIYGARKYRKSDMSFVGYSFIMTGNAFVVLRELPLPNGAYLELHTMDE